MAPWDTILAVGPAPAAIASQCPLLLVSVATGNLQTNKAFRKMRESLRNSNSDILLTAS
jgi:hypothetical protein